MRRQKNRRVHFRAAMAVPGTPGGKEARGGQP
jgi:hypothetical protein